MSSSKHGGHPAAREKPPAAPLPAPSTPPDINPAERPGVLGEFFKGWWSRKGSVVLALVDDLLLYGCFVLFVASVHSLLSLAGGYLGFGDTEMHKEIHKWGFLACDVIIVLGLARKLFVTLVLGNHD